MPRVNVVKKARKDYPQFGIQKGDTYYWWSFRYGGTHMSKTYPKPSQLTQSDFLQRVYAINEQLESLECDHTTIEDERDNIVSSLEEIRDECEEKRSNMPDQLQDSGSGETLQNRYDSVDEMINDLQNIDLDFDEIEELEEPEEVEEPDEDASDEEKEAYEKYQEAKEAYDNYLEAVSERDEKFESALEELKAISYSGE